MRKILFRGKCQESNEWLYGSLVTFEDGTCVICFKEENEKQISSPVIPETVGQFIGFKDNNGIDIFEGDIVKTKLGHVCEIKWDLCKEVKGIDYYQYTGFCLRNIKQKRNFHLDDTDFEIIGNIHDKHKDNA